LILIFKVVLCLILKINLKLGFNDKAYVLGSTDIIILKFKFNIERIVFLDFIHSLMSQENTKLRN
jgi:hypothetical protein